MKPPGSQQAGLELTERVRIQERTLDRQVEWVRSADSKVPILLGMSTTMLGVLSALVPKLSILTCLQFAWFWTGVSTLLVVHVCCACVLLPRTKYFEDSLVYFVTIAGRTRSQYVNDEQSRSEWEYLRDLLSQSHRNAEIACIKYKWVRRGFRWLSVSLIPWCISVYLLK